MEYQNVERHLIEYIASKRISPDGLAGLGIGDDAAFLLLSSMEEGKLIVSTDSVVENVHFKKEWGSYSDVAIKLMERSSSDILAKGGHPHWALLNMNITPEFSSDKNQYGGFIDMLSEKLKERHIALIGGDITRSAVNTFTLTVLGNASVFIRRKNPEVEFGDIIVMQGDAGGSTHALDMYLSGQKPEGGDADFYNRPKACWNNAWLRDLNARCSIDQSDSLFETFDILARDNLVTLDIDLDKISLHGSLQKSLDSGDPEKCAEAILKSAEDLAIIAILPAASLDKITKDIKIIGKVSGRGEADVSYLWGKKTVELSRLPEIYEHFQG